MDDLQDRYAHLTNTTVNQGSVGGYSPEILAALESLEAIFGPPDEGGPTKWSLKHLLKIMKEQEGFSENHLWDQIVHIVRLIFVPIILNSKYTHKCHAFEFYGFGLPPSLFEKTKKSVS